MSRLYGLDALRGIAALAVAAHHFAIVYKLPVPPLNPGLSVDLFFVLSGFVMTRTYEERMREGLTTPQFLRIRYRRLFPPLAVGVTIGFLWALTFMGPHPILIGSWLLGLAFLPGLWPNYPFFLNGPAWSLFLEILANAGHSAGFSKLRNPILIAVCAVTGFAALAIRAEFDFTLYSILTLIPRVFCCYLLGIIVYRTYGDRPLGNQPLLACAAFLFVLWAANLNLWTSFAASFIAAPLVVRASLGLGKVRWAAWGGALSYPLYATHIPAMHLTHNPALGLLLAAGLAVTIAFWPRPSRLRPAHVQRWSFQFRRSSHSP